MPGPVKARDLRSNIKDYGFEKGVVATLEALLDEYVGHRQDLKSMVDLQAMMITQLESMTIVNGSMATMLDKMQKRSSQFEGIMNSEPIRNGE